jgi:transcriptional regulator with XRE-family HTH domain
MTATPPWDFEALARELVRALRGKRSQRATSRRLGFSTNVVYGWESGRRSPSATETFRLAGRVRADVRAAVATLMRDRPAWLDATEPASPEFVKALLADLRGSLSIATISARSGRSRFAVSRWLSGKAEPRLPDLLRIVEATSLRVADLLAQLVDPTSLPSLAPRWRELEARRRIAWTLPWSHAVLRVLEIDAYRRLRTHRPGWIAARLGIHDEEERRCLEALEQGGLVRRAAGKFLVEEATVDTSTSPEAGRRALKRHWAEVGTARIAEGAPGLFSYNVFSVSRADLAALHKLHVQYFTALRNVVAASQPPECVVVANVQLFELGGA